VLRTPTPPLIPSRPGKAARLASGRPNSLKSALSYYSDEKGEEDENPVGFRLNAGVSPQDDLGVLVF
jgi:hypothetical protein